MMTRSMFSWPVLVTPGAADRIADYGLTAADVQTEMGKPESERSELAVMLTQVLRQDWDKFKECLQ